MEERQQDKRWPVQCSLEAREVARIEMNATTLAQRNARAQEQRRKRLLHSIQMPTAGCIMKTHRSAVFPMRTPVPIKMETASRDIAARKPPLQTFPITKQRSEQQHLATWNKETATRNKEKNKIRTKIPVSSPREVTSSRRVSRHLKNDIRVEKTQQPSIFDSHDSKNASSSANLKQQPSVCDTAGFAMGNRPFVCSKDNASMASSNSSTRKCAGFFV